MATEPEIQPMLNSYNKRKVREKNMFYIISILQFSLINNRKIITILSDMVSISDVTCLTLWKHCRIDMFVSHLKIALSSEIKFETFFLF